MKNTIGILFLLLLLLIGTCVYQKTYTLYALTHTTDEDTTQVQAVHNTHLVDLQEKKETSILEKIKSSVVSVVTSNKSIDANDTPNVPVASTRKIQTEPTITQTTLASQEKEKEAVSYLLKVLKERDATLTVRNEAENKLQNLIKEVLQDRQLAIEAMEKHAASVQKEHQKRLNMRDTTAEAIFQKYTEKKGK